MKMLGQEDNPARLREEIERAKEGAEGGPGETAADAAAGTSASGAACGRWNSDRSPVSRGERRRG